MVALLLLLLLHRLLRPLHPLRTVSALASPQPYGMRDVCLVLIVWFFSSALSCLFILQQPPLHTHPARHRLLQSVAARTQQTLSPPQVVRLRPLLPLLLLLALFPSLLPRLLPPLPPRSPPPLLSRPLQPLPCIVPVPSLT